MSENSSILNNLGGDTDAADALSALLSKKVQKDEEDVVEEKDASPLDKLINAQKAGKVTKGLVVSDEELEKGSANPEKRMLVDSDERKQDIKDSIGELDEDIKKRKYVTVVKRPTNQFEYMKMMDEISSVVIIDDKAAIRYTDGSGNPMAPEFIRLKEEGDPDFAFDDIPLDPEDDDENTKTDAEVTVGDEEADTATDTKDLQILIDKTGYGANIHFTEEERSKMVKSELIHVREVSSEDLRALISKKSEKTTSDIFLNVYEPYGHSIVLYFPASGFKATVTGMTYGEYADVVLSAETINFERFRKRLSILYNHIKNPSCRPFEDFEDFLHRFSYTDMPLGIYGLLVATESEELDIEFQCNNDNCNQSFNWKFTPRELLQLDRCSKAFIDGMQKLVNADPNDYIQIADKSAVMSSRYIEFPDTKFIAEIGVASAYHFLYNFIPLFDDQVFADSFPEETVEVYMRNSMYLTVVRKIYIPSDDGVIICESYKDILHAIYRLSPKDLKILSKYSSMTQSDFTLVFGFNKVKCPHCGRVVDFHAVNIDDLVFQTYDRLMNSEVDLDLIATA